nr:hypothetical protein [Cryptosporangium aurantiacum]
MLRLFEEIRAGGQTLVVVTHDARIAAVADRVVAMRDGASPPTPVSPPPWLRCAPRTASPATAGLDLPSDPAVRWASISQVADPGPG